MSGTSLDGSDIAFCEFSNHHDKWRFQIVGFETIPYSKSLKAKLRNAHELSGIELSELHVNYGKYLGELVNDFIGRNPCSPQFIASHGHTVFHQPHKGLSLQIGCGAAIAAITGLKVVNDFRSLDVALGGQGAPLVPMGDRLLFGEFDFCLNLGGFANISFENQNQRIAFDICPANIALNHFAAILHLDYDEDGKIAAGGNVDTSLLANLNSLPFYQKDFPKSLGREWLESEFLPLVTKSGISTSDILRTLTEHIAFQISRVIQTRPMGKVLLTGGGADNDFLVSRIQFHSKHQIILPDQKLVHYKEALVFAFLGLLRLSGQVNCLASVTGARKDSSGGSVYRS